MDREFCAKFLRIGSLVMLGGAMMQFGGCAAALGPAILALGEQAAFSALLGGLPF